MTVYVSPGSTVPPRRSLHESLREALVTSRLEAAEPGSATDRGDDARDDGPTRSS